ncbi:DNA-protecting protein DprA [Vibrio sinensis]|uniref:DNA-protecting protein DprA n=1 Tax=Vibrio sinensis TaxID=2302434 RepID=A0A3A6QEM3_9VIBR|nr:DNA-processing protein DprA [Vibrio sinensis]RJX66681.1 DNA-protecting protein DprA [Vibrio sinensis]
MNMDDLSAWLALYFTPKIGSSRFARLLAKDSPANILASNDKAQEAIGLTMEQRLFIRQHASQRVEACVEWQQKSADHHIVTLIDEVYPSLLKESGAAPGVLFVKGDLSCLSLPQIAMVGSRHASMDGLANATRFAKALVDKSLVVTSGLALGIDGHAHDGALQGGGQTNAVLGSGLNYIYPARHRDLAQRIAQSGALISEFHPDAKPKPAHFPRRNRIISGLSLGVLVIEAAEKSGSLITARYAAEQGRDVFAIPGSIQQAGARGCNSLIKQGACLVQNVEDVLDEMETLIRWSNSNKVSSSRALQTELFEIQNDDQPIPYADLLMNIGSNAIPVDILANMTNIPVQEVMMQLLELELSGHVVAVSGGYILKGRG